MKNEEKQVIQPKVKIRFLFNHCNDLGEMRHFYSDLLGLSEKAYKEEWGYLCYVSEDLEMMFFRSDTKIPYIEEWADQPGWEGGTLKIASWAIGIPEGDFTNVYKQLKSERVKMFNEEPEWRVDNYWGLTVKDPMGNTVEVYTIPKQKPESTTWKYLHPS